MGEDVTGTLEVIPRQWKVIRTVREKFTCRACETTSQPPAPFHPTPRGWAGPMPWPPSGCTAPVGSMLRMRLPGNGRHDDAAAGEGGTQTARLWTYARADRPFAGGTPPAALFHFSRDRGMANPNQHLAGWRGILQADAHGGYNDLYRADRDPGPAGSALCWCHARRKSLQLADIKGNVRKG